MVWEGNGYDMGYIEMDKMSMGERGGESMIMLIVNDFRFHRHRAVAVVLGPSRFMRLTV